MAPVSGGGSSVLLRQNYYNIIDFSCQGKKGVTLMNIKARLVMLNKTMSRDLRNALKERRIFATTPQISSALSGTMDGAKGREIREAAKEIVEMWEKENAGKCEG